MNRLQDKRLIEVVPSKRQLEYIKNGFYGFVHFTVNTFTDKEWGDGTEDNSVFNPTDMCVDQWTTIAKDAGMCGLILTCKHHDGFCLWPSKYTEHSVKNSPYKNGQGDIVKELSDSCREKGLKFGVYLSPWDRNSEAYGKGKEYDDYYINQLTELLTGYGDICAVWLDGACGEGANGKKQYYDWDRIFATVRRLQPNAVISICGPDIRWCGNESATTRESEWSVVPERLKDAEKTMKESQQEDNEKFRQRKLKSTDKDLGSRDIVYDEPNLIFYPSEVDVSIRPGWFYHADEDDKVKGAYDLFDIYLRSVGGNATLLLNVPPDRRGRIHENDENELRLLGRMIKTAFTHNLAEGLDNEYSKKDNEEYITVTLPIEKDIHYVILKEDISLSQRVEKYELILSGEKDSVTVSGTTIGAKKIIRFEDCRAKKVTLNIKDVRVESRMLPIEIY